MQSAATCSIDCELRENLAAGENVIRANGIAVVVRSADAAERLEERGPRCRTVLQCAGRLIEDGEAGVVPLHELGRADAAVHVRRVARGNESTSAGADAVEDRARR